MGRHSFALWRKVAPVAPGEDHAHHGCSALLHRNGHRGKIASAAPCRRDVVKADVAAVPGQPPAKVQPQRFHGTKGADVIGSEKAVCRALFAGAVVRGAAGHILVENALDAALIQQAIGLRGEPASCRAISVGRRFCRAADIDHTHPTSGAEQA